MSRRVDATPPSGSNLEGGAPRWLLRVCTVALAAALSSAGCTNDPGMSGSPAAGMPTAGLAAVSGSGGSSAAPAGSGAGSGPGAAGAAAGAPASGKLSFETVYERVIRARCGQCHNDGPSFGGLAFFPGAMTAYRNLVGVPAGGEPTYRCRDSGLLRVAPGEPEKSLLYLKLTAPPCGSKMPPLAFGTVSAEQVELVRQWIADGAAP